MLLRNIHRPVPPLSLVVHSVLTAAKNATIGLYRDQSRQMLEIPQEEASSALRAA